MKIYTRTGDDGKTSLPGRRRIPKYHPRIEANGDLDELNSWLGLLRDVIGDEDLRKTIEFFQTELMKCSADIASGSTGTGLRFTGAGVIRVVENNIDILEPKISPSTGFVVPGGNISASYCHIARCICRRAERSVLRLNEAEKIPEPIYIFLNRLSDYLYILARFLSL